MVLTAGTLSVVSVQSNQIQMFTTPATGGVAPYSLQWYFSTTPGFVPGGGNIIAGATSQSLTVSNLIPNTAYYFKVVYTDSAPASVTSAQATASTVSPSQNINQFAQTPFVGQLDLKVGGTSVVAAQIDVSQAGVLYAGQALQVVNSADGVPKVVACTTDVGDPANGVAGFVVYDIKSPGYFAGSRIEMALGQTCIWLYATGAIPRFAQVQLDVTSPASVQAVVAHSGANVIGYAYDQASAYGQLIRVFLQTPTFTFAA